MTATMIYAPRYDILSPEVIAILDAQWLGYHETTTLSPVTKLFLGDDGPTHFDEFIFDSNDMTITNIYMHTSTLIYQSRTDIKFECLYNFA